MIEAPFETELWIWALSACSGLYWSTLREGFDDMLTRMTKTCEILSKA